MEQLNVVGYFYDKLNDIDVYEKMKYVVVFEKYNGERKCLEGYNVIDGHFNVNDIWWLSSCFPITKEEYINATKGSYTPEEYLK